jgi:hypothetical protein
MGESSDFRDEDTFIQDERRLVPTVKKQVPGSGPLNLRESITLSQPLYQN